jgi:DNA repair exonuclease SbcCD nuclease subunit
VVGGKMNSFGRVSTNGVTIKELKELNCGRYIFGHFHVPSKLRKRMYYVGSPHYVNFGDSRGEKRIFLYNGKKLKSIDSSEYSPRMLRFLSLEVTRENYGEIKEQLRNRDLSRIIVKLVYDPKVLDQIKLEKLTRKIEPYHIDVVPVFNTTHVDSVSKEVNESNLNMSLGKYIDEYWKNAGLKKKALKIVKKIQNVDS